MNEPSSQVQKILNSLQKGESIDIQNALKEIESYYKYDLLDKNKKSQFIKIFTALLVAIFDNQAYLSVLFPESQISGDFQNEICSNIIIDIIKCSQTDSLEVLYNSVKTISTIVDENHQNAIFFSIFSSNIIKLLVQNDMLHIIQTNNYDYEFTILFFELVFLFLQKSLTIDKEIISKIYYYMQRFITINATKIFFNEISEIIDITKNYIELQLKNLKIKYHIINYDQSTKNEDISKEVENIFNCINDSFLLLPKTLFETNIDQNILAGTLVLNLISDYYDFLKKFEFDQQLINYLLHIELTDDNFTILSQLFYNLISKNILSFEFLVQLWNSKSNNKNDMFYTLFKFLSLAIPEKNSNDYLNLILSSENNPNKDLLLSLSLSFIKRSFGNEIILKLIDLILKSNENVFYSHNIIKCLIENKKNELLDHVIENYNVCDDDFVLISENKNCQKYLKKFVEKNKWKIVEFLIKDKIDDIEIVDYILDHHPSNDVIYQLVKTKSLNKIQFENWIKCQKSDNLTSTILDLYCLNYNKEEISEFPFEGEEFLWNLVVEGVNSGKVLIHFYNNIDCLQLNDEFALQTFISNWIKHFNKACENKNNKSNTFDDEKENLMRLLLNFVKYYDSFVIESEKHLIGQENRVNIPIYGDFIPPNYSLTLPESKRVKVVLDIVSHHFSKSQNYLEIKTSKTNNFVDLNKELSNINEPLTIFETKEWKERKQERIVSAAKVISMSTELISIVYEMSKFNSISAQDLLYEIDTIPEVSYKIRDLEHYNGFDVNSLLPIDCPFIFVYVLDKIKFLKKEKIVDLDHLLKTINYNIENHDFIKILIDFLEKYDASKIKQREKDIIRLIVDVYNRYSIKSPKIVEIFEKSDISNILQENEMKNYCEKSLNNQDYDNIFAMTPFDIVIDFINEQNFKFINKLIVNEKIYKIIEENIENKPIYCLELCEIAVEQKVNCSNIDLIHKIIIIAAERENFIVLDFFRDKTIEMFEQSYSNRYDNVILHLLEDKKQQNQLLQLLNQLDNEIVPKVVQKFDDIDLNLNINPKMKLFEIEILKKLKSKEVFTKNKDQIIYFDSHQALYFIYITLDLEIEDSLLSILKSKFDNLENLSEIELSLLSKVIESQKYTSLWKTQQFIDKFEGNIEIVKVMAKYLTKSDDFQTKSKVLQIVMEQNIDYEIASDFVFSQSFYDNVISDLDKFNSKFLMNMIENYPKFSETVCNKIFTKPITSESIDIILMCSNHTKNINYDKLLSLDFEINKIGKILLRIEAKKCQKFVKKNLLTLDDEIREQLMRQTIFSYSIVENYFKNIYFVNKNSQKETIEYLCLNYRHFLLEIVNSIVINEDIISKVISILEGTKTKMDISKVLLNIKDELILERGFRVCSGKCFDEKKLFIIMQNCSSIETFNSIFEYFVNNCQVFPLILNNYLTDDIVKCQKYSSILIQYVNQNEIAQKQMMIYMTSYIEIFEKYYEEMKNCCPFVLFSTEYSSKILKHLLNPKQYYLVLSDYVICYAKINHIDINWVLYQSIQQLVKELNYFIHVCESPIYQCFSKEEIDNLRFLLLFIQTIKPEIDQTIKDVVSQLHSLIQDTNVWISVGCDCLKNLFVQLKEFNDSFNTDYEVHPFDDYY